MKRAEFKKLFKECIKEAIIEDGVLSTIISEAVKSLGTGQIVERKSPVLTRLQEGKAELEMQKVQKEKIQKFNESKQKILDAIGNESYNGVNVFEGTEPIARGGSPGATNQPSTPLANVASGDAGVDISSIMGNGANIWRQMRK